MTRSLLSGFISALGALSLGALSLGALSLGLAPAFAQETVPTPISPQAAAAPAAPAKSSTPAAPNSNTFGAFSKNSGEPIDIESDVLVVHDAKKYATFKGNVKAVQGSTTIRSVELDVHYVGGGGDTLTGGAKPAAASKPATPAAGGLGGDNGTQISRIEARGDVIITSENDQTTTSEWALYDVPTQIVTVGGNVVLMQGKNMLKGDRLVIDLKTGESRFENQDRAVAGGRIRALFVPSGDAKGKKKGDEADASTDASPDGADETDSKKAKKSASTKKDMKAEKKANGGGIWDAEPNSLR
jgi:lipopolysaccharide export system protein LptA